MIHNLYRTDVFHRIAAAENIFSDAAVRDRLQFLMNHRDAPMQRVVRILDIHFFIVENNLSLIFFVDPEQTFHQCGFARAVFAHQGMHGSWADIQTDVIERFDAREAFTYIFHL